MSLRSRMLVALGLVALVLVLAVFAVTRATRTNLIDRVDDQLAASVPRAATAARDRPDDRGPRRPGIGGFYAVAVRADGSSVLLDAPVLDEPERPDLSPEEIIDAARERRGPFTVDAVDAGGGDTGSRFRVMARPLGRSGALLVALPLDEVTQSLSRLVVLELAVTGAVLGVLGLVGWWVVRLGIRPVKQMAATARAIGTGDLSHRVPQGAAGTEVGDLGVALNRMLEQIETAFANRQRSEERLRQFVADASHELRTPVATLRGYAELYRSGGLRDPAQLDDAMRRTEQEALRLGSLVDDLLLLARLDQGRPLATAPVRLDRLVADAVLDARARHPDRTIRFDGVARAVHVTGDAGRLGQVVANLVANAMVHTPSAASVDVTVTAGDGDGGARVVVADDGPGMPADVAARVFERFYRADPTRARDRGGSGLGLSIAAAIVAAHRGTISVDSAPQRGTVFTVSLPSSAPPPPGG